MSLKAFHLIFVTASVLLALFCAGWCAYQYLLLERGTGFLFGALGCLGLALGVVAYGRYVLRKLQHLSFI